MSANKHSAATDDPQYLVYRAISGGEAVHQASALKRHGT